MTNNINEIITSRLIPGKNFIYGFADLTNLLNSKFEGYNYGISIGRRLDDSVVDPVINGPTKEYYIHYKQINTELENLTILISDDLKRNGIEPMRIEPTVPSGDIDTKYSVTLRTEISHKMVATRAGLGWIGKSDLFISKDHGPRFRLVSVLVKTPLKPKSKPIDRSRCGRCNICVEACPAKAANGLLWDITVNREDFFDPWKCREQCAEFGRQTLGPDAKVCGICVAVCPVGRKH